MTVGAHSHIHSFQLPIQVLWYTSLRTYPQHLLHPADKYSFPQRFDQKEHKQVLAHFNFKKQRRHYAQHREHQHSGSYNPNAPRRDWTKACITASSFDFDSHPKDDQSSSSHEKFAKSKAIALRIRAFTLLLNTTHIAALFPVASLENQLHLVRADETECWTVLSSCSKGEACSIPFKNFSEYSGAGVIKTKVREKERHKSSETICGSETK